METTRQEQLDAELHAAAQRGSAADAQAAIGKGADVNSRAGVDKATPLLKAAAGGSLATIEALLAAKADPNALDADGEGAILYAARSKSEELVRRMVEISDPRCRDHMGRTPLMQAARLANEVALRVLLPLGGAELTDHGGRTAMDWAMERNDGAHFAAVRLMRAHAAGEPLPAPRARRPGM